MPFQFIGLAHRHGIANVELRSVLGRPADMLTEAERVGLRQALHDGGLAVCCIAASIFKCQLEDREKEFPRLERAIECAAYFSAPLVRVFSFWRRQDRVRHGTAIADALHRAGELARPAGVRLGIENGRKTMHCTGAELGGLLAKLDPEVHSAVWDPANSIFGGTDAEPVKNGYAKVAKWVAHVHVKDPKRLPDGSQRYVPLGQGDLPWDEQIRRLRADHYRGTLSLETHWRHGRVIADADLDRPAGESFSEGGYSATSASLRVLTEMLLKEAPLGHV